MKNLSFLVSYVVLSAVTLFGLQSTSFAGVQVGVLTKTEGEVKLFKNPSKSPDGPSPRALFEGVYYTVKNAAAGDLVEKGNILRTAVGAKARVVFKNGDQYNVGSGTAYKVTWDADAPTAKTEMNLMHGRVRAVVSKGGPRGRFTVRTASATMGVRGTDFFVGEEAGGGTLLSVMRGEVEVKTLAAQEKPVSVKTGHSLDIPHVDGSKEEHADKKEAKLSPRVELRKTSQEELLAIHQATVVKKEPKGDRRLSSKQVEELEALEKKAVEATLKDMKSASPELYAKVQADMKADPELSADDLHLKTVENLVKTAPPSPSRSKPSRKDLENIEGDEYKKYFHF